MRRRRTGAPQRWRHQTGAALIFALLITGLLLASNAVSLEAFVLTMRAERRGIDRMLDFHLADTMLTLCERHVALAFEPDRSRLSPIDGLSTLPAAATAGFADATDARDATGATGTANAVNAMKGASRRADGPAAANPIAVLRGVMAWKAEPTRWRDSGAFGPGDEPHASRIVLPAALAAPRRNVRLVCLIETWVDVPEAGRVLLLTARVPAVEPGAGSGTWLQSVVMLTALGMQRHWRAVAEPPAPAS